MTYLDRIYRHRAGCPLTLAECRSEHGPASNLITDRIAARERGESIRSSRDDDAADSLARALRAIFR